MLLLIKQHRHFFFGEAGIFRRVKFPPFAYLVLFFMLVCLYLIKKYVWLFSIPALPGESVFFRSPYIILPLYLPGPVLYLFVRSMLTHDSRLKKNDFWHVLPVVVSLLVVIPQMLLIIPDEFSSILMNTEHLFYIDKNLLYGNILVSFIFLSTSIFILSYTFRSAGLFVNSLRKRSTSLFISWYQNITILLGFLLGLLFLLVVSQVALIVMHFYVESSNANYTRNLLQILSGLEITGLFITPFFFPGIFYQLPLLPKSGVAVNSIGESHSRCEVVNSHNPVLCSEYLLAIGKKADSCMNEFQPYLHADFSLAQLAVMIQKPVHHLACYFRQEKKQSFQEYRNEWRIEHAKALMKEGLADGLTLEAIGYLSGFLNRNAFRNTFRKMEGILPSEFASKIRK